MPSRYQPVSVLLRFPCHQLRVKRCISFTPDVLIVTTLILVCYCCLGDVQSAHQELAAVRVTLAKEEQKNAALVAQVRLPPKFKALIEIEKVV